MTYKLKHLLRLRYGSTLPTKERIDGDCFVYGSNGIVGTHNCINTNAPAIIIGRKGSAGKITWAKDGGFCIDTAYSTDIENCFGDLRYAYYQLLQLELEKHSKDSAVPGLNRGDAYRFTIKKNPIHAQRKIADFLDKETARIDLLIEKKEQLLNLLIEQYLEPFDLHFRTSTKSRFEHVVSQVHRPIDEKKVETVVPIGLFNRGRGIFMKEETSVTDLGDSSFCFIKEGDLVLSGQFAWEGAVALVSKHEDGCAVSHRYPIFTPAKGINNAYLFAFFRTKHGQFILNDCSKGAAGRNRPLNVNLLKKWKIPIPDASEQSKIAALVQKEQIAKQLITTSISKLLEYKAALITAAVTGQIDVESASKSGTNEHHLDRLQKESEA